MGSTFRVLLISVLCGAILLVFFATKVARPFSIVSASSVNNEQLATEADQIQPEMSIERNRCELPNSFPDEILQWCQLIKRNAEAYQIDPNLIAAVMLQESGGKPDVLSASGAVGLMQIMPRDGIAASFQCVNGPCFSNRPTTEELQNPAYNIEFGSKMLSSLFNRYGNWRDALKSYGPMDIGFTYADLVLSIYSTYQ